MHFRLTEESFLLCYWGLTVYLPSGLKRDGDHRVTDKWCIHQYISSQQELDAYDANQLFHHILLFWYRGCKNFDSSGKCLFEKMFENVWKSWTSGKVPSWKIYFPKTTEDVTFFKTCKIRVNYSCYITKYNV